MRTIWERQASQAPWKPIQSALERTRDDTNLAAKQDSRAQVVSGWLQLDGRFQHTS